MNNERNTGFSIEAIMSMPTYEETAARPIAAPQSQDISDLLNKVLSRLSRLFSIEKASLALFNFTDHNLHVSHMYKDKQVKTGITLIVQPVKSTMYQVLMQGYPIVDNYPELISSNIIERKILLSEGTKSLLIVPLACDCYKLGVLTMSSNEECAFGTYLEGVGEGIVAELSTALYINQAAGGR
ncbi:MAG: hypothetical protein R3F48_01825 [Candidatus Zixiibacteriota bacterium]